MFPTVQLPTLMTSVVSLVLLALTLGCSSRRETTDTTPSVPASSPQPAAPAVQRAAWKLPEQRPARQFVASDACRSCHEKSHASWHRSFHRTMTQAASAESIQAPFDGRKLTRGEITCSVEKRGDKFWVTTPDPDIEFSRAQDRVPTTISPAPMVEREVVLVTGSHHMQIYWLPSRRGNELRIFPWVYSIDEQRWIPYEDSFVVPHTTHLMRANWNANCIACHTVDGKPNYSPEKQHFQSEVVEFGISCEACHGPGEPHMHWQADLRSVAEKGADPIVNASRLSSKASAQVCGQCHSDFIREQDYYTNGPSYRAGGDLDAAQKTVDFEARKSPDHPFHHSHWEDGTGRVGGREYLGLIASACYQRGELSCVTCHSMHGADPNQQLTLAAQSNEVCLNCHTQIAQDIQSHTHHAVGSSGSECYNCHMPRTSFALFRAMRSHRIDVPDAGLSDQSGRPNACNLCHLDKSLAWTAEKLNEWYGTKMPKLKSRGTGEAGEPVTASVEWLLRGDAAQRIVTAWHYGWRPAQEVSRTDWQSPLLAHLLNDPYSAVRLVAGRSLKSLSEPSEFNFDFLAPESERKSVQQQVLDNWHSKSRDLLDKPHAVLQLENGQLDQLAIERLLQSQDQRPVIITE